MSSTKFSVEYDEEAYKWLGVGGMSSEEFTNYIKEDNYAYLIKASKSKSSCNCYNSHDITKKTENFYECGCKDGTRIYLLRYLINCDILEIIITDYKSMDCNELHNLFVFSMLADTFINHNFNNVEDEVIVDIYNKTIKSPDFIDAYSIIIRIITEEKAINVVRKINETCDNTLNLLSRREITHTLISFILDEKSIDMHLLYLNNRYCGKLAYAKKSIIGRLLQDFDINEMPETFWKCLVNKNLIFLEKNQFLEKVANKKILVDKIISSQLVTCYFNQYIIPALEQADDQNEYANEVFSKIMEITDMACHNVTFTLNYLLDNYSINVTITNIKYITRSVFTSLHCRATEEIRQLYYSPYIRLVENCADDLKKIIKDIPQIDRRAIDVIITYGCITVDYEFLRDIAPNNTIYDITRFGLEYGEELYKIMFLKTNPVEQYYMDSTFIPQNFKSLWFTVASIGEMTTTKKFIIGKTIINASCVHKGDSCKVLSNIILKYVRNNPVHGYFLQLLSSKMPFTFNKVLPLFNFLPQYDNYLNHTLLSITYTRKS